MSERSDHPHRLLHRPHTALGSGVALLVLAAVLTAAVGPHPPASAPATTLASIGHTDQATYDLMQHLRFLPLTWLAYGLNVLGGGIVTIPLRAAVVIALSWKRRFLHAVAFASTWLFSELALSLMKVTVHRGRPPDPMVHTSGYSFPSGHSTAGASIGVALVVAAVAPGEHRRRWEWLAAGFAFLMGLSRVYLNAHWLSDAMSGVVVGAGIALVCTGVVSFVAHRRYRTVEAASSD